MTAVLLSRPPNNYNLIRLVAAWLVLFSHSYHLLGQGASEPLMWLSGGRMTLGTVAVGVFFTISGYLITASAYARPHFGGFLLARLRRIFPALILVVLICAFLIGPWYSSLSPIAYFSSDATYTYVIRNLTLKHLQFDLPGVFTANPYGTAVNGSLWTLPIEFALYLATGGGILVLRLMRQADKIMLPLLSVAVVCCLAWILTLQGNQAAALLLVPYFLLGAMYRIARQRLPLRGDWVAVLLLVCALSLWLGSALFPLFACLFISYATLWLARHPRWIAALNTDAVGDLSYGIYLFAFPIQQCLVASGLAAQPLWLCAQATMLVLPVAWLSWHLVERRFAATASAAVNVADLSGART
ncbi:acyltransferase family protein [Rugamonas aquatica]|uniref:Acyltransferase family protein n=1 Tax=Rugamonas aquatica TaxID=2743357 RepID=A0A6A7MZC5_9BURK|nr:acyltransferase [Rugamonas aquatica]MQA38008.1 acyltransferase family protein [Rugamonas aquatica]